ncbi:MAG: TonB-dependent receptor [Sphingomonadaceae bacterium]|nr:TonB-dependent receptor [Sphingomonadaceae bacterium]
MKKIALSRTAALCCGVSMLAVPQLAFAQTADEEDNTRGQIVVTATRDARDLQQVPMTVDVATGEDIEKLKIFDVKDISQLAPGLELTNNGGRNNTTSLRGQSFDPDQGTAPAVQVYYNEIPADAQTVYTAIYDIAQVEVLRGPQGQLRGQTAPAGAILIGTRRPDFGEVDGYIQGSLTDRHGYNLQGAVSMPMGDMFAVRVAGLVDGNRINHVRNITRGGEYSRGRTESGRVTLGFQPDDSFTAYLTYQYTNARNNQFTQVVGTGNNPQTIYAEVFGTPSFFVPPAFGGGPFAVDTTVQSGPPLTAGDYSAVTDGVYQVNNKTHLWNLAFDWDLDFATLSFVGAHQRSRIITNRDEDLGNALVGIIDNSFVDVTYPVDTQELRLTSNNTEGFGWGLGIFHSNQKGRALNNIDSDLFVYNTDPNGFVLAPFGPGGSFITFPNRAPLAVEVVVPIRVETTSFNVNARYVSGPLRIEGGIRYSLVRKTQQTQLALDGLLTGVVPAREVIPANLQDTHLNLWSGGASISYDVNPDMTVYAAYGNSFRVPSTGVSLPVGITDDLVRTTTERTNSFEVGVKGKALDGRLNYGFSAFYQKFNGYLSRFDLIFWNTDPALNGSGSGFLSFNYNGDADIKGIETQLNGRITDNWDFNFSASYTKGRYSNAALPCNDFDGSGVPNQNGTPVVQGYDATANAPNVSYCISNGRLSEVPDFSMSMNTEVRFPMGDYTPFVSALLTHRPGFFSEQKNFDYDGRQLLNMFAGVRGPDDKWEVSVFARNLFNQQKITNISLGTGQYPSLLAAVGGGVYDSGYRTVNVMNPREFGVTAAYRF